jgi:hypothetical protein
MSDQIFDDQTRNEMPIEYDKPQSKFRAWVSAHAVWLVSGAAVLLIGGIFWYFLSSSTPPSPESNNVLLIMKGPSQVTSNNEAEYSIVYRNGENASLTGVSLEVLYPSGFTFKSATPAAVTSTGGSYNLPPVNPGGDGTVVIRGKMTGSTGEDKEIRARLRYRLSNFNSEFVVEQNIHTSILPPDLIMDIKGPVDVVNGQDSTFTLTLTNVTSQDFINPAVQLEYPSGFIFTGSDTAPSKSNDYWLLGKIPAGSSISINISGSFTGDNNEQKLVKAEFGQVINNNFAPQLVSSATFRIIPSSLKVTLSATPPAVIKLGETINFRLNYTNQGNIDLNNLNITVNLTGVALDYSRIQATDAIITGQTITWKAASMPGLSVLSPNEKGEINFSVPVKAAPTSNLKNQLATASAIITSEEINRPTRAGSIELKLISALDLAVEGEYVSGAAPMKVGESTLFKMTFLLSNLSNDVSNAEVNASLPLPPSAWKNVIIPESEKTRLSYDSNSGKIRWRLGTLPAFTGKYSPVAQVSFQLEVVPAEGDINKPMELLKAIKASGTDAFVLTSIETQEIRDVDTGTIDDPALQNSSVQ